ncbi:MAG: helical backbone metal receptor [Phycisphaerae bacterium]|nr:helical backbone metal receptor [Phycisphaerae bacterium]
MGKWWLLLAALALWLAGGYAMLKPGEAEAGTSGQGPRQPSRIVSMAPNLTEILFALGLGDRVVGVTQDSDYPPAALNKPRVGTFWQPNIEAIIAAKPHLVVTLAFEQQRELARRLVRIGYDCLVVDIEKIDGLFTTIAAIGNAAAANEQARGLSGRIKTRIHRLQEATAGLPTVKVLWVVQREPLRIAPRDTFINEMIELAGGENAVGPTLRNYPPIGAEQVIAAGPEVIIEPLMVQGSLDGQRRQAFAYWARFTNVPAVVNKRIYVIDGDVVSRLGPRLPEGVETIAKCLRPELFGAPQREMMRLGTLGD